MPEPTMYARCLDTCARVRAMRSSGVDHGLDYCTCGFLKQSYVPVPTNNGLAERATRHALATGHAVHIAPAKASCTKCGDITETELQAEARAQLVALRQAASAVVAKYEAMPDGTLGRGLVNGDFFALRDALKPAAQTQDGAK